MGKGLKRRTGRTPEKKRYLVYCEGAVTETRYLEGLRSEVRRLPLAVKIGGTHGEPYSLVRAAIRHQEDARHSQADRYAPYDEVWCVIDVEAPKPHDRLDEALVLARRNDVSVALTNPCFELWVLLHFAEQRSYLTTAQVCARLGDHPCGYDVHRKELDYARLRDRHEEAAKRARVLREEFSSGEGPRGHNPSTDVDVLVDRLLSAAAVHRGLPGRGT